MCCSDNDWLALSIGNRIDVLNSEQILIAHFATPQISSFCFIGDFVDDFFIAIST